MCSWARMGLPAATRPTRGIDRAIWTALGLLDHAFAGERLQVFLGGVGRAEPELLCDLGSRRRKPGIGDVVPDQDQDFLLPCGELSHVGPVVVLGICRSAGRKTGKLRIRCIDRGSVIACIFIQFLRDFKRQIHAARARMRFLTRSKGMCKAFGFMAHSFSARLRLVFLQVSGSRLGLHFPVR